MKRIKGWTGWAVLVCVICSGCASSAGTGELGPMMRIDKSPFGLTPEGESVDLYTLTNDNGLQARIITYGGIVVSLETPDRTGNLADVVLGYDNLEGYLEKNPFFGCLVGRVANRIAGGRFTLDGVEYILARNNDANHLHGGLKGFDKAVWKAEEVRRDDAVGVVLKHNSPDGDEGYPGALRCKVTYWLTNNDGLVIEYEAETDRATPVNLTHHSYFNLAGHGNGDILGHEMMIAADRFTPVDETLIPTGELRPLDGSPLDFRKPVPIGARIDADDEQVRRGGGYDHNYVLNGPPGSLAARVREPGSGRIMEVYTTEPGMQFYSGNFLDGTITGKNGKVYGHRYGFCLETQHFPDSPNQPGFPSIILRPGERYTQRTEYRFLTD